MRPHCVELEDKKQKKTVPALDHLSILPLLLTLPLYYYSCYYYSHYSYYEKYQYY
jgi:hypothetical protein